MLTGRKVSRFIGVLFLFLMSANGSVNGQSSVQQTGAAYQDHPVQVMVLGTFHFDNPGRDAFNPHVPDVLTEEKQREIRRLVDSLERFRPTKIAIEDEPEKFAYHDSLYEAYRSGERKLERPEWEQIGYRLAARLDHPHVYPIDHEMTLPFGEMMEYAEQRDSAAIQYMMQWGRQMKKKADSLLQHEPLYEALKLSNSSGFRRGIESVRARMMTIGTDTNHVGADLQARWHKRNMRIFGNLEHIAEPGDRILVIFGGGHSPILRELVRESARMKLVEPLDYF